MWIKSFRLKNFKSFDDSGLCQLDRHINLIVGQNHSGKTALLKAIGRPLDGIPHKSMKLRRGEAPNPFSSLDLEFVYGGQEAKDLALARNFDLQLPIWRELRARASTKEVLDQIFALPELRFFAVYNSSEGSRAGPEVGPYPSIRLSNEQVCDSFIRFAATSDRKDFHVLQMAGGKNDNVSPHFAAFLVENTYYFDAQRIPQNDYAFGAGERLNADASNLAQVLNVMQANRSEFGQYVSQVRRVVPAIKWISVVPSKQRGSNVEIRIWNVDESTGRDDLTIPLAECGTGIGQVLSILYVLLKSTNNIVIVDEPNSFLHPRAAKALVGMFREDRRNQYIITSHSPEVIVASEPERLFMLNFVDETTNIREMNRADLASARQVLDEIGSQLSDVFGADRVLWVEGPTEVECFPLLLKAANREVGSGVAIAPLRNTGDLESRHGEAVADIYRNLSGAQVILPKSIGVSLDGDKRDMPNKEIIKRAFGDVLRFLPRRCYENYLINVPAIVAVLNTLESFQANPTTEAAVTEWIISHGAEEKFKASAYRPITADWLVNVDAPRLLEALFQDLSASKEIYRKTLHSVQLTKWLIENDPSYVRELIDYVASFVPMVA